MKQLQEIQTINQKFNYIHRKIFITQEKNLN